MKNDVLRKDLYYAQIKNIHNKILPITNLETNTILNAKIEVKSETFSIANLATTTSLNPVDNKKTHR